MLFKIYIAIFIMAELESLLQLYYFSKKQYDNFLVRLLFKKEKGNLLKSDEINENDYKKIKCLLSINVIYFFISLIIMFNIDNRSYINIIVLLLFMGNFIIEKFLPKFSAIK